MRSIERACARILEEGQSRAALQLRYNRPDAERFVERVFLEEGVRAWPPGSKDEVEFYAGRLILESYRPRRTSRSSV
jgi:hypothetical protein